MIPTIETPRLLLRPYVLSDFDAYAALWAEPDVVRYITGTPFSREVSWSRFLRSPGHWQYMGFGFLVIEDKQTGQVIGEGGFLEARRDIEPSMEGALEMGWALMPAAHGKGYAAEAMQAMLDWAHQTFPGRRMNCIIDPANLPSQRLAAKLGFVERVRTTYQGNPTIFYERTA